MDTEWAITSKKHVRHKEARIFLKVLTAKYSLDKDARTKFLECVEEYDWFQKSMRDMQAVEQRLTEYKSHTSPYCMALIVMATAVDGGSHGEVKRRERSESSV